MSEKQFVYGETDLFEWVEDNGKMISTKECVNKLNEQQATIKYLTIEKHQADKRFQTIIAELKKENEQLKIANAKWLDKSLQDKQIRYDNSDHNELVHKYLQLKEENEQLKKEHKIAIDEMITDYKNLEKENEQLKKRNKFLKEDVDDYHNALFDLHKKYDKLEKENEQLKKRLSLYDEDEMDKYLRTHPMPTTTTITTKRKVIPLNMRHKWY